MKLPGRPTTEGFAMRLRGFRKTLRNKEMERNSIPGAVPPPARDRDAGPPSTDVPLLARLGLQEAVVDHHHLLSLQRRAVDADAEEQPVGLA